MEESLNRFSCLYSIMKKDLSIELTSQLDYELLSAHSLAELTLILQNYGGRDQIDANIFLELISTMKTQIHKYLLDNDEREELNWEGIYLMTMFGHGLKICRIHDIEHNLLLFLEEIWEPIYPKLSKLPYYPKIITLLVNGLGLNEINEELFLAIINDLYHYAHTRYAIVNKNATNIIEQTWIFDIMKGIFDVILDDETDLQSSSLEKGMLQIAELCMQIFLEFKEATIHDPQYNERIFNSEYIRAVQKVLQILFKTIAKSYPNQASNISQKLWNIISGEQFSKREKLESIFEFRVPLLTQEEVYNTKIFWKLIQKELVSPQLMHQKFSSHILKQLVNYYLIRSNPSNLRTIKSLWAIFFDIYETLDQNSSHLAKSIWGRINDVMKYIENNPELRCKNVYTLEARMNDFTVWIKCIFNKVHTMTSQRTIRYLIRQILSFEHVPQSLRKYYITKFPAQVNPYYLYKDSVNLVSRKSKIGEAIITFYSNYFQVENQTSMDIFDSEIIVFLRSISEDIYFMNPLYFIFDMLANLPDKKCQSKSLNLEAISYVNNICENAMQGVPFGCKVKTHLNLFKFINNHVSPANLKITDLLIVISHLSETVFVDYRPENQKEEIFPNDYFTLLRIEMKRLLIDIYRPEEYIENLKSLISKSFDIKIISEEWGQAENESLKKEIQSTFKIISILLAYGPPQEEFVNYLINILSKSLPHCLKSSYLPPQLITLILSNFGQLLFYVYYKGYSPAEKAIFYLCDGIAEDMGTYFSKQIESFSSQQSTESPKGKASLEAFLNAFPELQVLYEEIIQTLHIYMPEGLITPTSKLTKFQIYLMSTAHNLLTGKEMTPNISLQLYIIMGFLSGQCSKYTYSLWVSSAENRNYIFIPEIMFTQGSELITPLLLFQFPRYSNINSLGIDEEINISNNYILQEFMFMKYRSLNALYQIIQVDSAIDYLAFGGLQQLLVENLKDVITLAVPKSLAPILELLANSYPKYIIMKLQQTEDSGEIIEEIRSVISTAVSQITNLTKPISPEFLTSSLKFIFSAEFLSNKKTRESGILQCAMDKLMEKGSSMWLIMRGLLTQILPTWTRKPFTLSGFESQIINLALAHEYRAEDSQLLTLKTHFYCFDKGVCRKCIYQEDINYHGAYIRILTITCIGTIIEDTMGKLRGDMRDPNSHDLDHCQSVIYTFMNIIGILLDQVESEGALGAPMPYCAEHRSRIRSLQLFVTLLDLLHPELAKYERCGYREDVVIRICHVISKLLIQPQTPCLRQFMEMILIKVLARYPHLIQEIIVDNLRNIQLTSQGRTSFLIIAGMLLEVLQDKEIKTKLLESLMCYLGCQMALTRSIAQFFLIRHYQSNAHQSSTLTTNIIHFIQSDRTSNKMIAKINMIFTEYQKLIEGENIDFVLCTPLNEMGENIGVTFMEELKTNIQQIMTEYKRGEDTDNAQFWKAHLEDLKRKKPEIIKGMENNSKTTNFQRKILAWEEIENATSVVEEEERSEIHERNKKNRTDLIVVASLIDKIPNMGGLSRTCEIFNASTLVLPSLNLLKDPRFTNVSVSSEKWMPIIEIPPKELMEYLQFIKLSGYTLIGLEQTANSKPLHEFKFPEKCCLLLGDEKEGIDIEYIKILDDCIEIPQFGIVRSLNVHVSAAISIWEFTKQQLEKPSTTPILNNKQFGIYILNIAYMKQV